MDDVTDSAIQLLSEVTNLEAGYLSFEELRDSDGKVWYYPTYYRCFSHPIERMVRFAMDTGIMIEVHPTSMNGWMERLLKLKEVLK